LVFWASSQAYPFMIAGVDTAQAAAFNAGMSILNAANVVRMTLANYLPAHAGRVLAHEGADALRAFARGTLFRIALAGVVIWPVVLLLGRPLVELLYGGKFVGADQVIEWVALGIWASMFSVVLNAVALALDTTRNVFMSNAAGALFSCTVGAYLTLTYGLVGAIWANVAGYVIPAVMQATHMWPHLKTRR
jgi:O-antigen/teichoic acid export membrane protein